MDFFASHLTVEPMPLTWYATSPIGTEVNSDEAAEKPRIAWPRSSICSVPKPLSARTDFSIVEATSRNFTGFSSTPLLVACLISEAMNFCWRCIRPRSAAPSMCRERTYWSAWPPSSSWV